MVEETEDDSSTSCDSSSSSSLFSVEYVKVFKSQTGKSSEGNTRGEMLTPKEEIEIVKGTATTAKGCSTMVETRLGQKKRPTAGNPDEKEYVPPRSSGRRSENSGGGPRRSLRSRTNGAQLSGSVGSGKDTMDAEFIRNLASRIDHGLDLIQESYRKLREAEQYLRAIKADVNQIDLAKLNLKTPKSDAKKNIKRKPRRLDFSSSSSSNAEKPSAASSSFEKIHEAEQPHQSQQPLPQRVSDDDLRQYGLQGTESQEVSTSLKSTPPDRIIVSVDPLGFEGLQESKKSVQSLAVVNLVENSNMEKVSRRRTSGRSTARKNQDSGIKEEVSRKKMIKTSVSPAASEIIIPQRSLIGRPSMSEISSKSRITEGLVKRDPEFRLLDCGTILKKQPEGRISAKLIEEQIRIACAKSDANVPTPSKRSRTISPTNDANEKNEDIYQRKKLKLSQEVVPVKSCKSLLDSNEIKGSESVPGQEDYCKSPLDSNEIKGSESVPGQEDYCKSLLDSIEIKGSESVPGQEDYCKSPLSSNEIKGSESVPGQEDYCKSPLSSNEIKGSESVPGQEDYCKSPLSSNEIKGSEFAPGKEDYCKPPLSSNEIKGSEFVPGQEDYCKSPLSSNEIKGSEFVPGQEDYCEPPLSSNEIKGSESVPGQEDYCKSPLDTSIAEPAYDVEDQDVLIITVNYTEFDDLV